MAMRVSFSKKKKKVKPAQPAFYTVSDYFRATLFSDREPWHINHPTNEFWQQRQILALCKKSLSTQTLEVLEELYQRTNDPLLRGLLARKSYLLRINYLQSYKEYSDRALILLTQRENLFDKWEGIYILGCFGTKNALPYLKERLTHENNRLLIQAIERAITKINFRAEKKVRERGF